MPEPVVIPADLHDFLSAGKQLDYDAKGCEIGLVRLKSLADLNVRLYPADMDNFDIDTSADPHHGEFGCYLVPGISLLAECEGYEVDGMTLWLPMTERFGYWDDSHSAVWQFGPNITWREISHSPLQYLNSPWSDDHLLTPFIPWPKCRYSVQQLYEPVDF